MITERELCKAATSVVTGRVFTARHLFLAVLTLLVLFATASRVFGRFTNYDNDFRVYLLASQVLSANPHADVYYGTTHTDPHPTYAPREGPLGQQAKRDGVTGLMIYIYPPLLADALLPISRLSVPAAEAAWRGFNYILLLLSLSLLAREAGIQFRSFHFAALLLTGLTFFPVIEAIAVGQITIVLLTLWTLAVVSYRAEKPIITGIVVAIAVALKITPLLVLPLFLIWKDRKLIWSFLLSLSAIIIGMGLFNGWSMLLNAYRTMSILSHELPPLQNRGVSMLAMLPVSLALPIPAAGILMLQRAGKLLCLLYYVTALILVLRRNNPERVERSKVLGIFSVITVISSPVVWRHAYTVALIPLCFLWIETVSRGIPSARSWLLALTTIAVGSLALERLANSSIPLALRLITADTFVLSLGALLLIVLRSGFSPVRPPAPIDTSST